MAPPEAVSTEAVASTEAEAASTVVADMAAGTGNRS